MKKFFALLLAGLMMVTMMSFASAEAEYKTVPGAVVIPAADAEFTVGKGVSAENKRMKTHYDDEYQMIVCLAKDGEVVYTVPEGVEGTFDLYLTVSKTMAQFTSQPFSFSINDGEVFSVCMDCQVSADSPTKYSDDGDDYNTGKLMDDGRFLVLKNVDLKAGDTVKVIATYGAKNPRLKGASFPAVGDLTLAPAGAAVPTGYDYTVKEIGEIDPSDPLSGLNIIWLGSSVTYGACSAGHYTMVDAIQDNHPGTVCEKYAISATTLVNDSTDSYVARLKLIPKDRTPDLVVVQLSTNDASTNKPFGEISESIDLASFDDTTIAGAIETIIAYSRDTFGCPVVFYTGTYFESENYPAMIQLLLDIQKKWGMGVINMYDDEEMTALHGTEQYKAYMHDGIHPNRLGYIEWWTPAIEKGLIDFLAKQ